MAHYDVIIIGSGAGGGTLASVLAPTGKRIAIIERGGFLPREPQNWDAREVFRNGRYVSEDTWTDKNGRQFQPGVHYYVGGATKLYGAALFRLRPSDFRERQFSSGLSPAWPLSYEDFEPWYTAAERMYHVRGHHGEDPTEGPWSAQYRHPAVEHEPRIQQLSDDLTKAGYHPFHAPAGVLPSRGCILCGTCDGFACQLGAKADAEAIAIRPLLRLPNVTLMTNATVRRIWLGSSGRAAEMVAVERDGQPEVHSADVIVVAAGAVNTAKLLLSSGLGGDLVGRNYMCHLSQALMGVSLEPNPTVFQKTLAVHDFYEEGWGSIQMLGKSSAQAMKGESGLARLAPDWSLEKIAEHALDFWLTTEDLPLPSNRVSLNFNGSVRLDYTRTNVHEASLLYNAVAQMLGDAGMHNVLLRKVMPLAAVAHQAGTAVFGTDPRTSVLDTDCKVWGLDNVYVADASFMPGVGAVNPALTIMANALRVGEHLKERLS